MKHLLVILALLLVVPAVLRAQDYNPEQIYVIVKNDGSRYVGNILSSDAREVHIRTSGLGDIIIPKHEIQSITEFKTGDDKYKEVFATRYFLTTNGLPILKGDSYIQWTLLGPDLHFGVHDNFSVGLMTSWIGVPVIGSVKYTGALGSKTTYGIGFLAGTSLWSPGDFVLFLPYSALTFGDQSANISFSAGLGFAKLEEDSGSQFLFSVGALKKITRSGTLVFDSLIISVDDELVVVLVPGVRLQTKERSAFQFGFPGIFFSGDTDAVGFPMISWFRKL
jgi:hypothetical protein